MPPRASTRKPFGPVAASLTWAQAMAWRARRHHLHEHAPRSAMLDVAAEIGGLHAQVMSSAELTLWARVADLEPDAVRRALWEERSLVKTWAMRGTLHLLPAAEFSLWIAAAGSRRHYLRPAWLRAFGVTEDELQRVLAAVAAALDGRTLTRDELGAEVARLTGSEELGAKIGQSWGSFLKPSAYRGELCFAPSTGQNVRFTRPDQWLPPQTPMAEDDAFLEITRRFLAAYGPATREDYTHWWGGETSRARALIARLGDEAVEVEVEGSRAYMLAAQVREAAEASPPAAVRLLPGFDTYVVAASPHVASLMPGPFKDRIYRPQGWISPVLLVDGRMDGVWRHERKGSRLVVTIAPFVELPPWVRRAAAQEAERLAAFLGGALDLTWQG